MHECELDRPKHLSEVTEILRITWRVSYRIYLEHFPHLTKVTKWEMKKYQEQELNYKHIKLLFFFLINKISRRLIIATKC